MSDSEATSILTQLIRCPSVTPQAGAALDAVEAMLRPAGFACERLVFADGGIPVDNLFARIGSRRPHLCFAGHLDVVPPGDAAAWSVPPFSGEIRDGRIIGRGAEDMKGAVAAAIAAATNYLRAKADVPGSVSFLLTADEEGPAVDGTAKVLAWMAANDHVPDDCIVGEPTGRAAPGDVVKVGRRGSLGGTITVTGVQGHVAYPQLAANPIAALMRLIDAISVPPDDGTPHFEPSHLEVTSIDVGNQATNVVPARAAARFNVRFNDRWSAASLEAWLRERLGAVPLDPRIDWTLDTNSNAAAFLARQGRLAGLVGDAVEAACGQRPEPSTTGGTSDARFIARYCPVIELGLVGRSMHQIDEFVPVAELETLARIYRTILERYFGP